ncbi:hypothetical protein G9A89_006659 [Geosiphon pyriformis]|nr:hypothetical protein G9A89_006659 [Geosiphon pyriformis]
MLIEVWEYVENNPNQNIQPNDAFSFFNNGHDSCGFMNEAENLHPTFNNTRIPIVPVGPNPPIPMANQADEDEDDNDNDNDNDENNQDNH